MTPGLLVLSHLRWTWVWQRPQQLVSRLARDRPVWFAEEPQRSRGPAPGLRTERHGPVCRLWPEVPGDPRDDALLGGPLHLGFDAAPGLGDRLRELLAERPPPVVWLYTPLALPHVAGLERAALVYDVMDDLAAFRNAPRGLRDLQDETLATADLVLAGGRSLYAGVRDRAGNRAVLVPSGVDAAHFAPAAGPRAPRARPVAGYVGVVDERLDLDLVDGLARALPGWDVELVGPLAKLEPAALPQAPNLRFTGPRGYDELPAVMSGFDVALMPFALSEATRSISPTKTLEYLAAGLPVVSTPVPDVVADHGDLVTLADDAAGFADACRALHAQDPAPRRAAAAATLRRRDWDAIAARVSRLVDRAVGTGRRAGAARAA